MQLHLLTLVSCLSAVFAASSEALPTAVTIAYSPVSTSAISKLSSPKAFAVLSYHASNSSYTIKSYVAPSKLKSQDANALVRIGLLPQSRSDTSVDGFAAPSTTVTKLDLLARPEETVLRIALDSERGILSAGLGKDYGVIESKTKTKPVQPRLEVLYSAPEPKPVLNKPVVLDREGKVPAQDKPEPSLLQRYWWVLAIAALLTLGGGGGGGEEGGK